MMLERHIYKQYEMATKDSQDEVVKGIPKPRSTHDT
jgi:hypothetical protein